MGLYNYNLSTFTIVPNPKCSNTQASKYLLTIKKSITKHVQKKIQTKYKKGANVACSPLNTDIYI